MEDIQGSVSKMKSKLLYLASPITRKQELCLWTLDLYNTLPSDSMGDSALSLENEMVQSWSRL